MRRKRIRALFASVTATLRGRASELRRNRERGSHAVEYAIGIGLGAGVIILLYGAYRSGVANIIASWVFK